MNFLRLLQPQSGAWLALLGVLWASLWPTLSLAAAPDESKEQRGLQVLICGHAGPRWVSLAELGLEAAESQSGQGEQAKAQATDTATDLPKGQATAVANATNAGAACLVCSGKALAQAVSLSHAALPANPAAYLPKAIAAGAWPLALRQTEGSPPPSTAPPTFSL